MSDFGVIITTAGVIICAVISSVTLIKTRDTHRLINSRMDEFLAEARKVSRAEGVAAGEQSQRDRDMPPREGM